MNSSMLMAIVVLAATLVGCAPMPPTQTATPYVSEDYDAYRAVGPNTVLGQALLRQRGGGVVTCAGTTAVLFPDSQYFREVIDIFALGRQMIPVPPGGGRVPGPAVRSAVCDASGNFAFEGVPQGRWILVAQVNWTVGKASQGGLLRREVEVIEGASNRFILAEGDRR